MKIIPDASLIFPTLVAEHNSEQCQKVLESAEERIFLDLCVLEVSNALWNAARQGRIDISRARSCQSRLLIMSANWVASLDYVGSALDLSLEINHPIYDCLYAAAAKEHGAILMTCDGRFARKLDGLSYRVQLI